MDDVYVRTGKRDDVIQIKMGRRPDGDVYPFLFSNRGREAVNRDIDGQSVTNSQIKTAMTFLS